MSTPWPIFDYASALEETTDEYMSILSVDFNRLAEKSCKENLQQIDQPKFKLIVRINSANTFLHLQVSKLLIQNALDGLAMIYDYKIIAEDESFRKAKL